MLLAPGQSLAYGWEIMPADTDSIKLQYPMEDQSVTPFSETESPFQLGDPSNIKGDFRYDPETGLYKYHYTVGDTFRYRPPNYMTPEEYSNYQLDQAIQSYWQSKVATTDEFNKESGGLLNPVEVESEAFDMIFGGNRIDIRPSGSAELILGYNHNRTENPALSIRDRGIGMLDFDQKIQVNVIGNIGDKLKVTTNYNTEATFNFENQIKVDYTGYEDEILQDIEAGNVALPLNSQLITGSQSLFGIKAKMRFGRLDVTTVISSQEGQRQEIEVQGGAQITEFDFKADSYEANKHYFLDHFFRDLYEEAVGSPPLLNTGVNITRVEVWVTNNNYNTEDTRNIIAFQDLGTSDARHLYNGSGQVSINAGQRFADNGANNLYEIAASTTGLREFNQASQILDNTGLVARLDYHKVGLARRLRESEYTLNPQLGYISLNSQLQPNQVLAVSFQYTFRGQTYQVGEFTTDAVDNSATLYLKMLKSSELKTSAPMWDLMMKNVYSLGAYQVQKEGFELQIWYLDRERGIELNYIPAGPIDNKPLLQVMGLDTLDYNQNSIGDGQFDFLDNPMITINPQNGRIYFPVLEPFGSHLRSQLQDKTLGDAYAFDSLYTNTQMDAKAKFPEKNRFTMKGQYQSSSSDVISLNALNVPEGSVQVTAGGQTLTENVDYTVDYTLGRVKILNTGLIESGTPIKVSLESNTMFNVQQKSLLGARFDYKVNRDLILGGTLMNLTERPLTQKTNFGDEPINNTVVGLDGSWNTDAPVLTRIADMIPGIDTKAPSTLQVSGEYARLFPGHNRAIGDEGNSYIDDFEGSQSNVDIRTFNTWTHASIPQEQPDLFPESKLINNLAIGFNRAMLSWYVVDPIFYRNNSLTPDHIRNDPDMLSNHFMRQVLVSEVFPNRELAGNQLTNIPMLDLHFDPREKGPYNYDVNGLDENGVRYSAGVDPATGELREPETRWGGIQRKIDQQDFEAANIEFIQFWMMDPYNEDYEYGNDDGAIYFNLGTVAEDIQRDGLMIYENVLSSDPNEAADITPDTLSKWGRVTLAQPIVNAFDNDPEARQYQDVGLDGFRNQEEQLFFEEYIDQISQIIPERATDPSNDDFVFYKDETYDIEEADILTRYMRFNNPDGNSPVTEQGDEASQVGSTRPNAEDLNKDNYLEESESYWQYKVRINRSDLQRVGQNYITDILERDIETADGRTRTIKWYQFKIPIREAGVPINGIQDFRSIRFMRIFTHGFENPTTLRFASLDLVRGEWRKYTGALNEPGDYIVEEDETQFNIGAVNIEENGSKAPVNYVLPPGIEREINVQTTNLQQQNEQSIALNICGLEDGQAKAAFRSFDLDVRSYKKIEMFVHGESADLDNPVEDNELTVFVRLGADFNTNYYEFEIPLKITPPGQYNPDDEASRLNVWPELNNIVIEFDKLLAAKLERNREMQENSDVTNRTRYAYRSGGSTIYIVGNPNLSAVKTIMMGVRNPKQQVGDLTDDGLSKCVEVWFNELRLTDFDEQGGWAAIGRVNAQMADFATLSVSGGISTPGWGSIEKKVSERQRETNTQFDVSANVELGKFLGEEAGVKIPMFISYSENNIKPQFNPLAPDVQFDTFVENTDPSERDSIYDVSVTNTTRKSINFTNVRKEPSKNRKGPAKFYDVSNFTLNYAYSEVSFHDFETEYDNLINRRGGINYNFTGNPKNYRPFASWKPVQKSKHLRLIKDFNFYLLPRSFTYSTNLRRMYQEKQVRNNYPEATADIRPFYNKTFDWDRRFALRWDLTRALKMDLAGSNRSLIRETPGVVNRELYPDQYELWRDSIWTSLLNGGTTMQYNQTFNVVYNLPFNKTVMFDWINTSIRYGATYTWDRAPFAADSLGNTIQNTRQVQINTSLTMNTLYNKLKFFREINRKSQLNRRGGSRGGSRGRGLSRGGDEEQTAAVKKSKDEDANKLSIVEHVGNLFMMLKSVSGNYSINEGLLIPGFKHEPYILGADPNNLAPSPGFIFGQQGDFGEDDLDYIYYANQQGWLVRQNNINTPWAHTFSDNLNLRASIEPVRDLRIELTGLRQRTMNYSEFYRYYDSIVVDNQILYDVWDVESPLEQGNYSITYNFWRTAFTEDGPEYFSELFQAFSDYRTTISDRLSASNPNSDGAHPTDEGYADGYGRNQSEVLLPAFLAAYSGQDPNQVGLDPFPKLPALNWRLTYNGLTKIDWFKKRFKTFTVSHAYQSTYNVGGYQTNINYTDDDGDGFTDVLDPITELNFVPQYQYNTVTLQERFGPLLNLDMTWQNSLITRFELKKDRTMTLSFANAQVTEIKGNEMVFGLGYTFRDVPWILQSNKPKRTRLKSDLRTRLDLAIRDNQTVIRKLDNDLNQNEPTGGQQTVSLKFTADYSLSNTLNLRFYFDRIVNTPVISLSYPTANTKVGFTLRFSITG